MRIHNYSSNTYKFFKSTRFSHLKTAKETVGKYLKKGDIVIYNLRNIGYTNEVAAKEMRNILIFRKFNNNMLLFILQKEQSQR